MGSVSPPSGASESPQNIPSSSSSAEISSILSQQQWEEQAHAALTHNPQTQEGGVSVKKALTNAEELLGTTQQQNLALQYIFETKGPENGNKIVEQLMTDKCCSGGNIQNLSDPIDQIIMQINQADPNGAQFPMLRQLDG